MKCVHKVAYHCCLDCCFVEGVLIKEETQESSIHTPRLTLVTSGQTLWSPLTKHNGQTVYTIGFCNAQVLPFCLYFDQHTYFRE